MKISTQESQHLSRNDEWGAIAAGLECRHLGRDAAAAAAVPTSVFLRNQVEREVFKSK